MKKIIGYLLLLLSVHFSMSNAFADTETVTDLTPKTNESGVVYTNGGIGLDQREALKAMHKDFSLQLSFAEKGTGEYLSEVYLSIENMAGLKVFESEKIGPLFLVQLTPGSYRIVAKSGDKVQTKKVNITHKGTKDLYFYW